MFNPILVEFKSRDMKVKILKEMKKLANANFSNLNISGINNVYTNKNRTKASRNVFSYVSRFQKENC